MRILILTQSYYPASGGLQTAVHTLARQLLQQGHEVRVVAPRHPRTLLCKESFDGVPVRRLFFIPPSFDYLLRGRVDLFLACWFFYPATLFHLARLMRKFQPSAVNLHFPNLQIPFILWLRRRFKFRLVVSCHGNEIERFKKSDNKKGFSDASVWKRLRSILHEADVITTCSHHLLNSLIRLEPSVAYKARVIWNGIDTAPFKDKMTYVHPRPYILAFGRLAYVRGFDLLLQAFHRIALRYSNIDLIIAGDGPERNSLEGLCETLGLQKRVVFFGQATQGELVPLLNTCEWVVIPSRQEAFGIAALEAMAAGKCVLATRVGGMPEFADTPSNLLVAPTVDALAEGLQKCLGQRDALKARGEENRKRAAEHTSLRMVTQYLEAYSPISHRP